MKNKLLLIGIIVILIVMLVALAGCGNNTKDEMVDKLNEVVKTSVDKWQERGYGATFSLAGIQNSLEDKKYNYVIIASGDSEFTNAPKDTKYTESISNYSGTAYSNARMLEKELSVKNCIILDVELGKYYNVEVTYKTTKLNDIDKEYPYFQNAKELK